LIQTQEGCDRRKQENNTKHKKAETPKNKLSAVEKEDKDAGRRRVSSPEPPRRRSDAVEPVVTVHGLKNAERGPHAHQGAENSQARGAHAPITNERHDRSLLRQGRKTMGNAAGGSCQSEVGGEV
jgi:hypothetical protein